MRNQIKIILLLSVSFVVTTTYAQTITNFVNGHPSAVLDMSNNPDGKSFLPPRVELQEVDNIIDPIVNPTEGLIVYNIGNMQLKGYYIFMDNIWSLMASRENSISNAVFNKATTSTITLPDVPSFTTITGFTELFNNTGGSILIFGNNITLQEGQYVVNVELNITTTETNTNSIGNSTESSHVHFYSGQLFNGSGVIGDIVDSNASSNTSGSKSHKLSFTFAFALTSPETVSFQLARRSGGTYTGAISINNAFIQIEKSLL